LTLLNQRKQTVSRLNVAAAETTIDLYLPETKTESIEDDFVDAGAEDTPTDEPAQAEAEAATPAEDSSAKSSAGGKKKKGKK
jgi:hypothetical protein